MQGPVDEENMIELGLQDENKKKHSDKMILKFQEEIKLLERLTTSQGVLISSKEMKDKFCFETNLILARTG